MWKAYVDRDRDALEVSDTSESRCLETREIRVTLKKRKSEPQAASGKRARADFERALQLARVAACTVGSIPFHVLNFTRRSERRERDGSLDLRSRTIVRVSRTTRLSRVSCGFPQKKPAPWSPNRRDCGNSERPRFESPKRDARARRSSRRTQARGGAPLRVSCY